MGLCHATVCRAREWTWYFWKSFLLCPIPTLSSPISAVSALWGRYKCLGFFSWIWLWGNILLWFSREQKISCPRVLHLSLTLLTIFQSSKEYLWEMAATLILSSAEGCVRHYLVVQYSSQFWSCKYFSLWEEIKTFWGENKTGPGAMTTGGYFRSRSPHVCTCWK